MILNVLNEIENEPKRNGKIKLMEELKGSKKYEELFKRVSFLTYDPTVNYYIKEIDFSDVDHEPIMSLYDALYDLENIIGGRVFTGHMARDWINQTASMLSEDDAEVFKRVIRRDLRCGVSAKTVNKVWDKHIYTHPYNRCSSFSEKNLANIKHPCYSQTKMDGLYLDIIVDDEGEVEYRTRNGHIVNQYGTEINNQAISNNIKGQVLQCEAVALNPDGSYMSREDSNGYLNSDNVDTSRVCMVFWDIVTLDEFNKFKSTRPYSDRWEEIQTVVCNIQNSLGSSNNHRLVDTIVCRNQDDIIDHFRENRLKGEEGTVIKDFNAGWKDGINKHNIKVKVVFDCDLKVIGFKEGEGKYIGQLGSIHLSSSDGGTKVWAGTGLKDDERIQLMGVIEDWVETGKIAKIRANDIILDQSGEETYTLFLPRFVEARNDKNEADDTAMIKEQVAAFTDALKMIGG